MTAVRTPKSYNDKASSTHRFLIGTCGIKNNFLHLLEYSEEHHSMQNIMSWGHEAEVLQLSTCFSTTKSIFASVYSAPEKMTTGLNCVRLYSLEGPDETSLTQQAQLQLHMSNNSAKKVLWDPSEESSSLMVMGETALSWFTVEGQHKSTMNVLDVGKTLTAATWDVHHKELCVVSHGSTILVVDQRSPQNALTVAPKAHGTRVRALTFNPNVMYRFASAGDDGAVSIWDFRKLKSSAGSSTSGASSSSAAASSGLNVATTATKLDPLVTFTANAHHINDLHYNPSHDQLLLTASSDNTCQLWHASAVSAAATGGSGLGAADTAAAGSSSSSSAASGQAGAAKPASKKLTSTALSADGSPVCLATLTEFGDSVYTCAWSTQSPWVYAAVSYNGKVLVNKVPVPIQRSIMLRET